MFFFYIFLAVIIESMYDVYCNVFTYIKEKGERVREGEGEREMTRRKLSVERRTDRDGKRVRSMSCLLNYCTILIHG